MFKVTKVLKKIQAELKSAVEKVMRNDGDAEFASQGSDSEFLKGLLEIAERFLKAIEEGEKEQREWTQSYGKLDAKLYMMQGEIQNYRDERKESFFKRMREESGMQSESLHKMEKIYDELAAKGWKLDVLERDLKELVESGYRRSAVPRNGSRQGFGYREPSANGDILDPTYHPGK